MRNLIFHRIEFKEGGRSQVVLGSVGELFPRLRSLRAEYLRVLALAFPPFKLVPSLSFRDDLVTCSRSGKGC